MKNIAILANLILKQWEYEPQNKGISANEYLGHISKTMHFRIIWVQTHTSH